MKTIPREVIIDISYIIRIFHSSAVPLPEFDNREINTTVAFEVAMTVDTYQQCSPGERLAFNVVLANTGNYYSTVQHAFVCPDDRVYFFHGMFHALNNGGFDAALMVNGVQHSFARVGVPIGVGSTSFGSVVQCTPNVEVSLARYGEEGGTGEVEVHARFSGFNI